MSPELVRVTRIMRLVVLLVFTGYMLWQREPLTYFFALVGAVFIALTIYQLWSDREGE